MTTTIDTKQKNIYIATLLALIFPRLGMLNIGEGKKAILSLIASILTFFAGLCFLHYGFFSEYKTIIVTIISQLPVHVISGFYCYKKLKKDNKIVNKWYSKWYYILLIVVLAGSFSYGFRKTIIEPYSITYTGMEPYLCDGETVIIEHKGYKLIKSLISDFTYKSDYRRERIYVYYHFNRCLVGRIAAIHNDFVEIKDAEVYINNINYSVKYRQLAEKVYIHDQNSILNIKPPFRVPKEYVLIALDNLSESLLSRVLSLIPDHNLEGEVSFIIWDSIKRKFIFKAVNPLNTTKKECR